MIDPKIYEIYKLLGNAEGSAPYKRLDTLFEEYINPTVNLINDLPQETFVKIKWDVGKDLSNLRNNLLHPAHYTREGIVHPQIKELFKSLDTLLEKIYPEYLGTD